MQKSNTIIAIFALICIVILLSPISSNGLLPVRGAPPPNTPYEGSGDSIDVYEFAKNSSITFTNGANNTQFSYLSSWYPSGYKGYLMHTEISNLRRTEDPVPNGDFEEYDEPITEGGFWEITLNEAALISDLDNGTGGNPNQCLWVTLKDGQVPSLRSAYIDNVFDYMSEIAPDELTLHFDIKFSADVTTASWLFIKVSVLHGPSDWSWSNDTLAYHPTTWQHHSINTGSVNGSITLRISILKQGGGNANVRGTIYFDNFHYVIGTESKPSEVGLKLNSTDIVDGVGNAGLLDTYKDPIQKAETPLANCWDTDQAFQFSSPYNVSFDYNYAMYIKRLGGTAAITSYSAPVDQNPTWEINYTVPGGVPPSGHTGYSYGLYLRSGWTLTSVKNSTGYTISTYTYNTTTRFFKMNENVASIGKTYSIYASGLNYVLQIYPQKASSALGPWTNVTSSGYYVKGNWIRVMATLRPIGASNNYANVSLFYPNRTIWQSNASPAFDSSKNTLTTGAWEIQQITESAAGRDWLITVSFDNNTQCGMRQKPFAVVIETKGTKISPISGTRFLWGQSVTVNVTWQNNDTNGYIDDASARIRYVDRNLQVQYVTMTGNGQGAYSTSLSTNLMSPDRNAQFFVELFRYGYVNASYSAGTHLTFTINLVNDINYVMIKPTQLTGTNEYTGETASTDGYTSKVRFYDPYRGTNVRNDTSPWLDHVRVNYTRYEDTGSGYSMVEEGSFVPNASEPIYFYKYDESYEDILQNVKYEVTMWMDGASWDYEQQNFTIIIKIVKFSTDLNAIRTTITYPPSGSGDGWTQYSTITDTYEVHVYWNEIFNITVFYENVSNSVGLSGATVKILIGASLYDLSEKGGGYFNYTLDTTTIGIGTTYVYVNASLPPDYAAQTINIRVIVETRATSLTKDVPGTTTSVPYDDDFVVTFTYRDTVPLTPISITDATWLITGYVSGHYVVNNNGDGTYTVTFFGNVTENTYYVTITFSRTNYTSRNQYYEITVRQIHTQSSGFADPVSAPWSDNVTITLNFNDTDHSYLGIIGATITFNWQNNIEGVDYWLFDNGDGSYIIILNTTKVGTGTQGFTITFYVTLNHYDSSQSLISFQVRNVLTTLYIVNVNPGTSVPWGDNIIIYLTFNDSDHEFSSILGATLTCDWDLYYWSYSYNATMGAYVIVIETTSRIEGSYTVHIYAAKNHYQTSMTIQGFVSRNIQTSYTADPLAIFSHPWGDNASITVNYLDLDHGVYVPYADVSFNWNVTYFTIYHCDNGTYIIEFNTTCRETGSYKVTIILSRTHYASQTIQITLTLRNIQTGYTADPSYFPSNPWGDSVNVTIYYLDMDHEGYVVGATVTSNWNTTYYIVYDLGNGTYIVELNTTCRNIGTYNIIIQLSRLHYNTQNVQISLTLRSILTSYTVEPPYVPSHPWGGNITIYVEYTDMDHGGWVLDATTSCDWNASFYTIYDLGNGTYIVELNTTCRGTGTYTLKITMSKLHFATQIIQISLTLRNIQTSYTVNPAYIPSLPWGDSVSIRINFLDMDYGGYVIGALVTTDWNVSYYTIYDLGNGTYIVELETVCRSIGSHTLHVNLSKLRYATQNIEVDLILNPIRLTVELITGSTLTVEYNDTVAMTVRVTDHHGWLINDSTVVYSWAGHAVVDMIFIGDGVYNITFLSNENVGTYIIAIEASNPPYYQTGIASVTLLIQPMDTILTLDNQEAYFEEEDVIVSLSGTAWTVPVGDIIRLYFNFTDGDGNPIASASGNIFGDFNGSLLYVDGFYVAFIYLNETAPGASYQFSVYLVRENYKLGQMLNLKIFVSRIQTEIQPVSITTGDSFIAGQSFIVQIKYYDLFHHVYISGGSLSLTCAELGIFSAPLYYDSDEGYYEYPNAISYSNPGDYVVIIEASQTSKYQPTSLQIRIVIKENPMTQQIYFYGIIAAIIGMFLLGAWFAWSKVFSIPWLVRKMRGMSRSIGRGRTPHLSGRDVDRISTRTDSIAGIAEPAYDGIGMAIPVSVLPVLLTMEERKAEDEGLWAELEALEGIGRDQKMELFEEMKRIPAKDRVWFLEDLKRQMADGTRFGRVTSEPTSTLEVPEGVDPDLISRLDAITAMSPEEKAAVVEQLKGLSRAEQEEVIGALEETRG